MRTFGAIIKAAQRQYDRLKHRSPTQGFYPLGQADGGGYEPCLCPRCWPSLRNFRVRVPLTQDFSSGPELN